MSVVVQVLSMLMPALIYAADNTTEKVPNDPCVTMNPGYAVAPQRIPIPYKLFLNRYDIYMNELLMFTIEASPGRKIRSFMVQARNIDEKPIGEFFVAATDINVMDCDGGERNMATQASSVPKDKAQMLWRPPEDYAGTCTFFATVVEDRETYWVMHPAEKVLSIKFIDAI